MKKIIKNLKSVKAAMMMAAVMATTMFASCSSDSDSTVGGNAAQKADQESTQKSGAEEVKKAAKVTMAWEYEFGDSLLYYCDAKVIYTDADGQTHEEVVDQSKCTRVKDDASVGNLRLDRDRYELKLDITKFPSQSSVRMVLTPKASAATATTRSSVATICQLALTYYDAQGQVIGDRVMVKKRAAKGGMMNIQAVQKYFDKLIATYARFSGASATYNFSADANALVKMDVVEN